MFALNRYKLLSIINFIILLVLPLLAFTLPVHAAGGRLYLQTSNTSLKTGEQITITLYVDSGDSAIDSGEGKLTYPTAMFDHVATSVSGTQFKFWTEYPEESGGMVAFGGGKPNPGYSGTAGKILSVVLKAKQQGTANIGLTGRLLSNGTVTTTQADGLTLNILQATSSPTPISPSTPTPSAGTATITSATHPDQNEVYTNVNPVFAISYPTGTSGMNIVHDKIASTIPASKNTGLKSSYQAQNLEPGTWYVHVKLLTSSGWGSTSHFKFTIVQTITATSTPVPTTAASPEAPKVEFYDVKITDTSVSTSGSYQSTSMPLEAGGSYVKITAVDDSGNKLERLVQNEVSSIKIPELNDPVISESSITPKIEGKTEYPKSEVIITFQKLNGEPARYLTKSDESGAFSLNNEEVLEPGKYYVWAEVIYNNTSKSYASSAKEFEVADVIQKEKQVEEVKKSSFSSLLYLLPLIILPFLASSIYKRHHKIKVS